MYDQSSKASLVRDIFTSVSSKYDIMNDIMSAGIHRHWKQLFAEQLSCHNNMRLLDVAGGTGDIAFKCKEFASKHGITMDITICDINPSMLQEGKQRAINRNCFANIEWLCGNAESLPLPDQSVDAYTIAFGIRNVTHIDKVLAEAYRVLKPGGQFLCLEFSHVKNPMLEKCYALYSDYIIPTMGQCFTGDRRAYSYLVESIRRFPKAYPFEQMIGKAGFEKTRYQLLSGGVAAIHSGWKL